MGAGQLLYVVPLACLLSCSAGTHWGYEPDDGPEAWASMDPEWRLCTEGREQSPIDLVEAERAALGEAVIDLPSAEEADVMNQGGVTDFLDNGHTIQVDAKSPEILTVAGRSYQLEQFHFHAPSEHTVAGEHSPMEMHFVYQADDGGLAVIGVFIEEGEHNPAIDPLWVQLGAEQGAAKPVLIPKGFADYFFVGEDQSVFHYRGSLTTPPCTEDVAWYVRRTPARLSRAQIDAFTQVYDHNNRPVQSLHDRTLYLDPAPRVTIR